MLVVHVPKTGGTSLRRMLAAHVPPGEVFLSTGQLEFADQSIRQLSRYTLFVGHNFLEPMYLLPDEQWTTLLAARDPVAWWRSLYSHTRQRALEAGLTEHAHVTMSMGQWVDSRTDEQLSNGQTSWLLARTRIMFDSRLARAASASSTVAESYRRSGQLVDLLDMLLERITVLGVTENLQQVYVDACKAFGWEPIHTEAMRENVTPQDPELVALSDAQLNRLRGLNGLDRYLYERALERNRG